MVGIAPVRVEEDGPGGIGRALAPSAELACGLLQHRQGIAAAEYDRVQMHRAFMLRQKFAEAPDVTSRSEEHTSELQSLMRISYAVFCLKKKKNAQQKRINTIHTI